ncbi:MAG: DUF4968 domain-containing protein, partial [Calditrichaeota bacterium]
MIASTLQKRLFLILFVIAGSLSGYQVVDNGVVVELPDAGQTIRLLQVQVIDEEIIRVVAAPKTGFSARASLIVEKTSWPPTAHQISQQGEIIELSTAALKVKISEKTGQIGFYDAHGRPILLEEKNGGKTMMPAVVMDEPTFHIEQRFSSPLGEAFYGLGQHQYDWMNYRGKDLDLYQINIIAAVPFLVSNRHYGILWDNNSRSKFGDPADFLPLSSLKLYDEQQTPGGLRVDYFQDSELKTLLLTQKESVIAHDNLEVWDNYPSGFDKNRGSIRWSGFIECERSGYYNFRFYSSHYAKFWFDDELKVDSWRVNWMPWARIVRVKLQAGRRYPIKIEWTPNGGYLGLTAKRPEKESYQNSLSLYSEVADQIDYYFIHGSTLDQVIAGYRNLTGQAPMMPKWAMGLWQCRQRYQSQEELINVVKEFRQRDIPLDNIVQDWFYWPEDKWGDHDFDAQRFPDPAGMVEQLHHELNTHIMISVWPKFYVGTHNYAAFQEQGWLYPRNVEKQERDWVGRGYVSTFYDPYSEGARDLFWRQIN